MPMLLRFVLLRAAALAVVLSAPSISAAVWICHGPNGSSWQQEYPPCVTPDSQIVQPARKARPVPSQPSQQPAAAPKAAANDYSVPSWERNPETYAGVLAELEQRYPSINPDSPAFDKVLLARVANLMQQKKQSGAHEIYALRAAVSETFTQNEMPRSESLSNYSKPPDDPVNLATRGVITAAMVIFFVWVVRIVFRSLLRATRQVAGRTAQIVEKTSAADIARAAGSIAGAAERKASPLIEAFKEGRRDRS